MVAKRISLILAALLALTLTGCDDLPQSVTPDTGDAAVSDPAENQEPLKLSLAYSHDDTLNPFAATTEVNCQLTSLLYEGLMALDENFVPQAALADTVVQPDATHLVVSLRQRAPFPDGSQVTPKDVITSFQEAKKSARYKALLQNVASAKEEGDAVRFKLTAADPNARACLIFPVVKGDTLTDKAGKAPIGSGPYKLKTTDTGATLVQNKHYPTAPNYTTVTLCHLPNQAARQYALSSGDVTYCYNDLSEGDIPRITGASRKVETNALVFLGINGNRGKLRDAAVRRALSGLLDRAAVTKAAYGDWALASASPFHPKWDWMTGLVPAADRDLDGAIAMLDEAGCTPKEGKRLELELIFNADRPDRGKLAEQIRTQAEQAGVVITATALSEKEYRTRLKSGKYDLYLGEILLSGNMSLRPLLAGGNASYGVARSGAAAKAYGRYLKGEITLAEFVTAFSGDMPYIPLCWRYGAAGFDRRLTLATPTGYDPYYGIAGWQ